MVTEFIPAATARGSWQNRSYQKYSVLYQWLSYWLISPVNPKVYHCTETLPGLGLTVGKSQVVIGSDSNGFKLRGNSLKEMFYW